MKPNEFFILLAIIYYSNAVSANELSMQENQQAIIKGIVTESKNDIPVTDITAKLLLLPSNKIIDYTVTNEKGEFSIKMPTPGEYLITFDALGYKTEIRKIIVLEKSGNNNRTIDIGKIKLKEGRMLNEITVTAQTPILTYQADKIIYDVSRDPDRFKLSMLRMMEKLPFTRINVEGIIEHKFTSLRYIVLINGKESRLINSNRQYPMSLIKAEFMKNIEIISPPPEEYANYDVVININLSKPLPDGYAVENITEVSTNNDYGVNPDLVFKIGKVVSSLEYRLKYKTPKPKPTTAFQENFLSDNERYTLRESISGNKTFNNSIILGSSYDFKDKSYISTSISTSPGTSTNYTSTSFLIKDLNNLPTERSLIIDRSSNKTLPSFNASLRYFKLFKNQQGSFQIYFNTSNSENSYMKNNLNEWILPYDSSMIYSSSQSNRVYINNLSINYRRNFKKIIFGILTNLANRNYNTESNYNNESSSFENSIDFIQNLINVKTSLNYRNKLISVNAGIALNNVSNNGKYIINDISSDIKNNNFNIIHNLKVDLFKRSFQIGIIYSQSIYQPGITQLNPYIDQSDPKNIKTGNPELKPEMRHDIMLGFGNSFKDKLTIGFSINGSYVNNSIEQITTLNDGNTTITTFKNIGEIKTFGGSANFSYNFSQKINCQGTINYGRNFYSAQLVNNINEYFNALLTLRGTLWKGSELSSVASFHKGSSLAQSVYVNTIYEFSLKLSQTLIKDKLTCKVSILNPQKSERHIIEELRTENFLIRNERYETGRELRFSLRFVIGNFKEKVRSAGTEYNDDIKK